MILNQQQIEEIEQNCGLHSDIPNLLETVKALRKENEAQRELLESISRLRRMNFEDRPNGIHFCDGEHEKHAGCLYRKLTAEDLTEIFSRFTKQIREHLK